MVNLHDSFIRRRALSEKEKYMYLFQCARNFNLPVRNIGPGVNPFVLNEIVH